ncbi:helix-turn-helix domain-containing protein [Pigmentiphaga sp.]|uniref:helix-turn-helix domain-containing protein n=1 Tax=Pigmentiphaga sp. TaxID=1977564 RepID=UPI0025F4407A|nr:helix-turn-helix domain-containing protein [Pigmentiphaga sp.]
MARTLTKPTGPESPLVVDLQALGQLVRNRRAHSRLRIDDAAALVGVSKDTLSRLENGKAVGTDKLMSVLQGLGLACFVVDKSQATTALNAIEGEPGMKAGD